MNISYITRPIAKTILNSHHKVVIVEGARAVGKTSLAQSQLVAAGYEYCTLADNDLYQYASSNPTSWFRSLPSRVIIDEAQRIDALPLLVKEAVDRSADPSPQYILTGSASIGKSSLDGQDPLVRRACRLTVNPLTQREIAREATSIVDDLWMGEINASFAGACSRSELIQRMSIGGFPQYIASARMMGPNERGLSIRSDIANILGGDVVPGERFDSSIADTILQALLCLPGNILNVNRISQMVERNNRTVTSYLDVLSNRFLIRALRNQSLAAGKQGFTRAKIHPVDVSFSMEAFRRAGKDIVREPELFGFVLESFVANQVLPAIEWSRVHPDAFFWREAGNSPKEVDLVLVSEGKMVGIEVKSSDSVDSGDFRSLRALAKRENLARGYVVYMGRHVIQEDENLWALPVDALWRKQAFKNTLRAAEPKASPLNVSLERIIAETPGRSSLDMTSAANIFLSYNHADNDHLDNGIIQFVEKVVEEYEFSYGESLSIFVDTESITWGEDWQKALDRAVEATNFLMPAVTPRYIRSPACRDELFKFYERTEGSTSSHLLTMIWQPVDEMDLDAGAQRAREIIRRHQYIDTSGLRDLSPSDAEYKRLVRSTSEKLHEAIVNQKKTAETGQGVPGKAEDDEGLFEQFDRMGESAARLQDAMNRALAASDKISEAFNAHPAPANAKRGSFSAWGAGIAKTAQSGVNELNASLDEIEGSWLDVQRFMSSLAGVAPNLDDEGEMLFASLVQLKEKLELPSDIDTLASQIEMLQKLTPRLKPVSKAYGRFIEDVREISGSLDMLIERKAR